MTDATLVNGSVGEMTANEVHGTAPSERLKEMNAAFARCLTLVCPPIQYPPHCRVNPAQQDAADMSEIEARLEEFFLQAKQLELFFLDRANRDEGSGCLNGNASANGGEMETNTPTMDVQRQRHELEMEIYNLETELNEKNDLIEKYADVMHGWEGKFKRLSHRLASDRE